MSDGIEQLSAKVKAAQIELERATQALYRDVNSPNLHAAYNHAVMALDKAEDELERALTNFKRKF